MAWGIVPRVMVDEGKGYGGGLHEMEPCELGNLPAETIVELLPGDLLSDRSQRDLFGTT